MPMVVASVPRRPTAGSRASRAPGPTPHSYQSIRRPTLAFQDVNPSPNALP